MELVPLHTRPDLIAACINILKEEWPNGQYERLQKLEKDECCPNPPCSLVLVSNSEDNGEGVVGHCRIVPVEDNKDTLFIEAVVIDKNYRDQGHGWILASLLEKKCSLEGFKTLIGKAGFNVPLYLHMGYEFTDMRPKVKGGMMLDYSVQNPQSVAYPGWEHYHKPYDGTVYTLPVDPKIPPWAKDIDGLYYMMKVL